MRDGKDITLEAFVDGQLDDAEASQFAKKLEKQPELAEQVRLSQRIDESLGRLFAAERVLPPIVLPSDDTGSEAATPVEPINEQASSSARSAGGRRRMLWYALAACLAWVCVGAQFLWPSGRFELAHRQRPLVEVYQECLDMGFSPYWVCDDPVLFAATFEERQGAELELAELPPGCRMEGLAYLAGLSLNSTSLLARVDEQPVIVFVDKAERDWFPPTGDFQSGDLVVQRTEKHGLVFYEVGPPSRLKVTDYLRFRSSDKTPAAPRTDR